METNRFESLSRSLARATGRRAAIAGVAAGLLGLGLGRQPVAARCGDQRDPCFRNTDCCEGLKCANSGDVTQQGRCVFKNGEGGKGDACKRDAQCRSGVCRRGKCR